MEKYGAEDGARVPESFANLTRGVTDEIRVAFSHDWLNGMRGGEKCLEALSELYPEAVIFTLFLEKTKVSSALLRHEIRVSPLQRLPNIFAAYRYYLPLFPAAVGSFRLEDRNLVISTSHCVAKGIKKKPGSKHLCYCFTPMRYAWGFFEDYFGAASSWAKPPIHFLLHRLRKWDKSSNGGVDVFIAISKHVKNRIFEFYGREAEVVYPPADTEFYTPDATVPREDFYLVVSALVPYKKTETAVRAFKRMNRKLVVIGDGPEKRGLEKIAGPGTRFLGWQTDEVIRDHYRRARALVFPGEEDFGIVPVEAQSCGLQVLAYAKGGALETVTDRTGLFFNEQTEASLVDAVERFEVSSFDPLEARANAVRFSRTRFKSEMKAAIDKMMSEK